MRLRLICALGAVTIIAGGLALIAGSRGPATGRRTSPPAGLSRIISAQLAGMHVLLTAPPRTVAVSAEGADRAVLSRAIAGKRTDIRETVLATCSMTPHPVAVRLRYQDRPCWVVLLKPEPITVSPPPGSELPASEITPDIRVALVDASTGEVFGEADGYSAHGA